MLYGQIKVSSLTYDDQEGLRFDAKEMFPALIPNLTFKNDWFTEEAPDQFTIRAHGVGVKELGQTINQFSGGPKEVLQFTDGEQPRGLFGGAIRGTPTPGLADNVDNKYVDKINEHKDKIKKVLSFACNPAGTMNPAMYEKMMGHVLDHVSMVPEGKLGLSLAPTSNYLAWGASHLIPNSDAVHDYSKVNGQWVDQGLYNTKLDNAMEVGAAVGAPILAHSAYKNYKKKQKKQHQYYGGQPAWA